MVLPRGAHPDRPTPPVNSPMNPTMDMARYDDLSEDNKRLVTRWVNKQRIYDATLIAAETEGTVLIHRPTRPITWFGGCIHEAATVGIRYRITDGDPPPWLAPTWDDHQ